jgi:solute carrier family 12 sodium/potassium/chloride transporter 2
MEMAGLGKLRPNMMMIGFQEKWWACPDDADEFYKTLLAAFDLHLSVGVLRVQSGFDLSSMGPSKVVCYMENPKNDLNI